jgi:hypothetical protein
MGQMVAKEFVQWHIAPRKDHKHRMWAFIGKDDPMKHHPMGLEPATIMESMKRLSPRMTCLTSLTRSCRCTA